MTLLINSTWAGSPRFRALIDLRSHRRISAWMGVGGVSGCSSGCCSSTTTGAGGGAGSGSSSSLYSMSAGSSIPHICAATLGFIPLDT